MNLSREPQTECTHWVEQVDTSLCQWCGARLRWTVPVDAKPMEYEGGGEGSSTWRETSRTPDGWLVEKVTEGTE